MRRFACCLLFSAALMAQAAAPPAAPSAPPSRTDLLQAAMAISEPGAQLRSLEAFAAKYPKAPELADVYNAIIQDAAQLNDDERILIYNEKLEALDPNDLAQRVKTLNLLLLESDAAHQKRATEEAAIFAKMVEAKAAEPPPAEMGPAEWRLNVARLRSVAALFQGTAAQAVGSFPEAEADFVRSLQQGETEEAAEHLGNVYVAENKLPQAVNSFALALALPGSTIAGRARLRHQAGALYSSLHGGSEKGFGDLILQNFDQVAARDADQQRELDPAAAPAKPGEAAGAPGPAPSTVGGFTLTGLDGQRHTLAEEAGKVVVLDFWATWCGPCKVQHPILTDLERRFASHHDVIFLGVNEDEDPAKVAPFVATEGWAPEGIRLDQGGMGNGLGGFLGIDSLPTTLVLDPTGAVVYRQSGFVPATFETELQQAIAGAVARATPAAGR